VINNNAAQTQFRRAKLERQQRIISKLATRITDSLDLQTVLDRAVTEVKLYLKAHRVVIYELPPSAPGTIVAEAVEPQWRAYFGNRILDTCFQSASGTETVTHYREGLLRSFPDIYQSQLAACDLTLLETFQVKSVLVVPILLNRDRQASASPQLWGLFIAHQCDSHRQWQRSEISILERFAVQVAVALEQEQLLQLLAQRSIDRESAQQQLRERTEAETCLIQELANTSELLGRRDRELDAIATVTTYNLRAPLNGIANLATWLAEDLADCLTPETRQQIDLLQSCVGRMSETIEDLLQYVRVGQQPMSKVVVNVGELLTQIIDSLDVPPEFTIVIASEMPTLSTERGLLQQVFTHLIANAVKHHDSPNGRVEIFARPQAQGYLFEIFADGPGIAPQDRERIFEVFQRLQPNGQTHMGLGLAIAKKTIELRGGKIWVDANVGAGSKFSFTWTTEPIYL
jgi:light-regulated signal transduction histidine kinase (bacteriophytochrome)